MVLGFNQLTTRVIPVLAYTKQKVAPVVVERPEVGIRWGKPSRFEFSNAANQNRNDSISVSWPSSKERLEGTEVWRKWEMIKATAHSTVTKAPIPSLFFEFERPAEMFFYVKEEERYEEDREDLGGGVMKIQPKITTVYHYIKLAFPLNDSTDEVVASGERGEHPDVTLAKTQAEFDATLAGQMQKSKLYWKGVFETIKSSVKPSWV